MMLAVHVHLRCALIDDAHFHAGPGPYIADAKMQANFRTNVIALL
jgi:hypothetical protein